MKTACIVVIATLITGCGSSGGSSGGSGGRSLSQSEIKSEVERLGGIVERADILLIPRVVGSSTVRAQGQTTNETLNEPMRCQATRCIGSEGTVMSIPDLLNSEGEVSITSATFRSRDGFNMSTVTGTMLPFSDPSLETAITRSPSTTQYGLWGEHGYAAAILMDDPISGQFLGVPFSGNIRGGTAAVYGDTTGTNPTGTGSATWTGFAEGLSSQSVDRHTGTATISIPDLSSPRVNAVIKLGGREIGSWADMTITSGRYEAGRAGSGNYLVGDFHGPAHEETYGVFDSGDYIGAYGARRR